MDKTENEIRRGKEAEQLLANPLIVEAKAHIEAELWRLFKEVGPQDAEALKHIKSMQYFHHKFHAFFERVIADGKIAQINLESRKKTLRERVFG